MNEHAYDYMTDIDAAAISNKLFLRALATGRGPTGLLWRGATGGTTMAGWARAVQSMEREAEIMAMRVSRDACPYCQVRADVGCRHTTRDRGGMARSS
jgi:hypothetical protein